MTKCFLHPGRDGVANVGGKSYCQICRNGQIAAAHLVAQNNPHVEPKDCFVTHLGGDRWAPIEGTGCAHWVAHQLGISQGNVSNQCLVARTFRVPDLVLGRPRVIELKNVRINDIWASTNLSHCGLVVQAGNDSSGVLQISIKHDSSAQGRVATNDFRTYFHGQGIFYR
jgi:hypothetical protein